MFVLFQERKNNILIYIFLTQLLKIEVVLKDLYKDDF